MLAAHPLGFIELIPLAIGAEDLVLVIWALAAMLVVGAAWILCAVIFEVFGNISILGAHPFSLAAGLLKAAMNKLGGQLMTYLDPVAHFFYGLAMMFWRPLYVLGATIAGLTTQILGVSQASSSGLADVRGQITATANSIDADISRNVAALNDRITAETNAENADISRNVDALNGEIADTKAGLESSIQANVSGLENIINERVTSLQGQIADSAAAVEGDLRANTTGLENVINERVNTLEGQITNAVSTAEGFATSAISGAGPGLIAAAVAQVQPQLSKIQTAVDDCLEPLCDTVTPNASRLGNLGNLFKGLEDLGIEALMIALAVEAVHDPAAVVSDISGTVNAVGGAVMSGFRDLVGV